MTRKGYIGPTARAVLGYRDDLENGRMTLTEVGALVGVTRERVCQLCVQLKIDKVYPLTCCKCKRRLTLEERAVQSPFVGRFGGNTILHYCCTCRPRVKMLIRACDECGSVYVLMGSERDHYIGNKNHRGVKRARCPECKAKSAGYREWLTVQCAGCGCDLQRQRHQVLRAQKLGRRHKCVACMAQNARKGLAPTREAMR